ncbi:MAG: S1 RNA-binding domain-containing protein [Acetivibrio ethanolgignens]
MIELGKIQTLIVVKKSSNGVYLNTPDGEEAEKVLLPNNQVPEVCRPGDELSVFIYKDSEDRPIATRTVPYLTLGETAVLEVVQVSKIGAFLNWGLAKDLFLPFREQTKRVKPQDKVLVALYIDKSDRLCATMNVYHYLKSCSPYKKDDQVSGIVYETSGSFGIFVAVDNKYSALIPKKEAAQPLFVGDIIEARVASVREDGKLNLSLRKKAYLQMDDDSELIFSSLQKKGFLPLHDKSDPEDIRATFGLSKNAFKRAVGHLLKEGKITLVENGIRLKKK